MTIREQPPTDWRPALEGDGRPAYVRIVKALAADIARGALPVGSRLPTQRALAARLGLGVGTVTRAYAEAEARGLIEAAVGRGSFVASSSRPPEPGDGLIDLSRNVAPLAPAQSALRKAMAQLVRRADLDRRLDYAPDGGFEADRRAGALWLRRAANFADADAARLIVTSGAQQAIAAALGAICRPGEALVVEAATFHGVKLAAAQMGLRLVPAGMDAEGLTPDALEAAACASGARAAYVQPFQNPTARVMGAGRRRDILEVARRRGITLVEDDLYGPHVADLGLPPLAQLAPDVVAYVSGLSKSLAPGVRTGFLIPPGRFRAAAMEALRAVAFGPPALGAALGAQWIESGEAFDILSAARGELARRTDSVREMLAGLIEPPRQRSSPHVWLPSSELDAERIAGRALRAGVRLTAPRALFLDGVAVDGLRICLGAAPDLATLERGLAILKAAFAPGQALSEPVV